ncbi:short-chain dehydrogenase, partial [Escherichia coli]|nr:short-chain dehydrogenase [Escherichia coli]
HAQHATESPLYAGRALAALAADPGIAARAGAVLHAGDLARVYGFTDADGTRPERFRVGP